MGLWMRMIAGAALLTNLSGCDASDTEARGIQGEWTLDLVRIPVSGDSVRRARGVMVFGSDLRAYPGPPRLEIEPPYIAGRSYLDLRSLWGLKVDDSYVFLPESGSDLLEEAVAKIDSDSLLIILAPHVVGGRLELRGVFRHDSIQGTWFLPAHRSGITARGVFTMVRVPAGAFTDSARARSQRVLGR